MLVNDKGNVMIPKDENNGHVSIEIYETVTTMQAHSTNPTIETEPDRSGLYIGTKLKDAKATITSLDGMTMAEKELEVLEELLVTELQLNYKLLQRTKFDVSDWVKE
jgi:hypothetical protein